MPPAGSLALRHAGDDRRPELDGLEVGGRARAVLVSARACHDFVPCALPAVVTAEVTLERDARARFHRADLRFGRHGNLLFGLGVPSYPSGETAYARPMRIFERDAVALAYDDEGARELPVVVFLHGLSQSRTTWASFLPPLRERFRLVRLDQRGHGESSHATGTYVLDTYLADTIAFLEEIVRGPSFLVGHSLGGVIAHGVAQQRADLVTGVLLEDPPLYVVDRMADGQTRGEASSVATMFPLMQQLARDMQARNAPVAEWEAILANVPSMNGKGTMGGVLGADAVRSMAGAFARLDPDIFTPAIDGSAIAGGPDTSKPIGVPAVVLRADPSLGAAFSEEDEARFLELNTDARVAVIDGASHAIHDEQPERFTAELLTAVSRARSVSSS